MMNSYSQLGEDIYLFQNFFNQKVPDAVIIEVGAYDGLTYSNTLMLEEFTGGKVILVEPSPISFQKLTKNRLHSNTHRVAISDKFGVAEFCGSSAVSGIIENMTEKYKEQWNVGAMSKYKVLTIPMNTLIDLENVNYIDFISIDVQGAELNVLQSMNWSIPTYCICLELERHDLAKDEQCRQILRENGFEFKCLLHISEFWINRNYYRSHILYDGNIKTPFSNFSLNYFKPEWVKRLSEKFYI